MDSLGWLLLGLVVGAIVTVIVVRKLAQKEVSTENSVSHLLSSHFHPLPLNNITITQRQFPFRMRADLQREIDRVFGGQIHIRHFCGVRNEYSHESVTLTGCISQSEHNPTISTPPEYEELDIGEDQPVRVLKNGLWLLEKEGLKFVVLLAPEGRFGEITGIQYQVGTPNTPEGTQIVQSFFKQLEESVLKAESYRGKILSLEESRHSYSGQSKGIKVHQLRHVERDQVILPEETISLLERNVIQFVKQREQLSHFHQATRKGLLFYGPPGTGKTHTIHYLARALEGHTTLLISAEQVGLLGEYMTLARLLQPSIVIIEDVDLIARNRSNMNSACEEVMLNKLLNEMDGLNEEADILFILTTNRPETLEAALASRPGRIDQAIEFPLPDEAGRAKLVQLYSQGLSLSEDNIKEIASRTAEVSAAFIKELLRRIVQFHIEANGNGEITHSNIDQALNEMLFQGGNLNLKLLGAANNQA